MRFILRSAFWLGLMAFLLPGGGGGEDAGVSPWGALLGAQQALEDVAGFCARAPQACESGREIAVFAGERIGEGIALAYRLVEGQAETALAENDPPAASTDPVTTGSVGTEAKAVAAPIPRPREGG